MHLLFLYLGIPAPREVYPANPGSVYVLGYAWDREIMPADRYDKAFCWENHLPRRDVLCDGGICIQLV